MKKLLLATLTTLSIITTSVSADPKAEGDDIYNPNSYLEEYDTENNMVLLIPNYFKRVYKDTDDILEKYIPMYFKGELFPVCIERIYRYYYYDDNDNKIYIEGGTDIYNINGNDYISIRD